MITLAEVDALAEQAHAGVADKIGVPYVEHVRAVAAGLAPFGERLQMAGLLHDVIEDTDWTADRLRSAGVPEGVVAIVERVSRTGAEPYDLYLRRVVRHREAVLVKIADNAHNSRTDRAARLTEEDRARLAKRYHRARDHLWPFAEEWKIEAILTIVNPDLLEELG